MAAKKIKTVGDLRKLIEGVPDDLPVVNDVTDWDTKEYTAGIVSAEVGIPSHWAGVGGVTPALWFHLRIRAMES